MYFKKTTRNANYTINWDICIQLIAQKLNMDLTFFVSLWSFNISMIIPIGLFMSTSASEQKALYFLTNKVQLVILVNQCS